MEVDQMLILSRKLGERILIDGGITITVTGIHQSVVRLGIEAPADVPVSRGEIYKPPRQPEPRPLGPP